jgi:hypothetical protein
MQARCFMLVQVAIVLLVDSLGLHTAHQTGLRLLAELTKD